MSHDIIAKCRKSGERISSITISAHNQGKSWLLYESLNCTQFNSGVSGNGKSVILSENELKVSICKLNYLRGEPEDDLFHTVDASFPCRKARGIFSKVLSSIGGFNSKEHIRIKIDKESFDDIEKFLSELQNRGEILIHFT